MKTWENGLSAWEANAAFWDDYMGDESNYFHRDLVRPSVEKLLDVQEGDVVLDIACGNGNFSKRLAENGARVVAFDYSPKMIELAKRIKLIVDDKARYTDWSTREDIKANLQVDLILLLDEFDYPPVTIDDVYKEVLEQAENFKKYAK